MPSSARSLWVRGRFTQTVSLYGVLYHVIERDHGGELLASREKVSWEAAEFGRRLVRHREPVSPSLNQFEDIVQGPVTSAN